MQGLDGQSHKYVLERLIKEHKVKNAVEVGVKQGRTFQHLLQTCPDLNLVGVDLWAGQAKNEANLRTAIEPYGERALLKKGDSAESAVYWQDYSLDLVFIDADHSEAAVRRDILAWRRKVRPGGILCGHDTQMPSVRAAIDDLCPGWVQHEQAVWALPVYPSITTVIPYADDRNFGRACNQVMSLLPEDGWGCVLDHDVMFTTPEWHRQLTAAVVARPDATFSAMTNRIKCPFQQAPGVNIKNHDYAYHREYGQQLLTQEGDALYDMTASERTPAGFLMLMSKQAWRNAGQFPEGLHYLDRVMWLALREAGYPTLIIKGLYLYHWHRGAGEPIQRGEWVTEHTIPGRKTIKLLKRKEDLPVYTG